VTVDDLVCTFRQRAGDNALPHLWHTSFLYQVASEAEREACVRARLIWDETSSFLTIPIVADQPIYALDQRIDRIERVTFFPTTGRPWDLILAGIDRIEQQRGGHLYTGWDWHTGYGNDSDWQRRKGRPEYAVRLENTLRLWPMPHGNYGSGTIQIACYRYPLDAMETPVDEPEIPVENHDGLVDWMLYRAYSTKDQDDQDDQRALGALATFNARFGERPSADVLRRHREKRRVTTRYGGI
jgi:hypothetical protein